MRKLTLPSRDIKGNVPVRSLYSVPVRLSVNAANQNKLAAPGVLLSSMILKWRYVVRWVGASPTQSSESLLLMGPPSIDGKGAAITVVACEPCLVLHIPWRNCLM